MEEETQERQPVMVLPQGEQQMAELPSRRQYERQLAQEEQPMMEWTQGE